MTCHASARSVGYTPTPSRSRANASGARAARSRPMYSGEIRIPIPGFARAQSAGSAASYASGSTDHSKNASDGSSPARPRSRTRPSCVDVSIPAVDVYQTCGFGRVDSVGSSAAIASSPRLYASSRITRSAENPRPDPDDRAMNRSRFPFFSSIASDPPPSGSAPPAARTPGYRRSATGSAGTPPPPS